VGCVASIAVWFAQVKLESIKEQAVYIKDGTHVKGVGALADSASSWSSGHLIRTTGGVLIRDDFFWGDFAITKEGVKVSLRKNVRTSSTREFPDEVLDILGFFLRLLFTPSFVIVLGIGHSKKTIL
jgi:hypothetical protein